MNPGLALHHLFDAWWLDASPTPCTVSNHTRRLIQYLILPGCRDTSCEDSLRRGLRGSPSQKNMLVGQREPIITPVWHWFFSNNQPELSTLRAKAFRNISSINQVILAWSNQIVYGRSIPISWTVCIHANVNMGMVQYPGTLVNIRYSKWSNQSWLPRSPTHFLLGH